MLKLLGIVLLSLFLIGCSKQEDHTITNQDQLTIVVASDLHYFSRSLYENYSSFSQAIKQGDGKMVDYGDEIIDQFITEVNMLDPDLVVISGDLSFNGDIISNKEIADKLKQINTTVLVIPGNHDIDNYLSTGYSDDGYIEVDTTTSEGWWEIYDELGYHIAISKDTHSCSYMVSINSTYNMILIDDNGSNLTGHPFEEGGFIPEGTMDYLKECLETTQKEGKIPLITMHHNLAIHNSSYYESFTNIDYEELCELFNEYHVPFVLSGHMHLQSIKEIEGIYDIASSSLLVTPLQYGIIHLNNEKMDYHTKALDIDLDSVSYYQECFKNRILSMFIETPDDDFLDYFAKVNTYYFSGTIESIREDALNDEQYIKLKEENKEIYAIEYLDSILENDQSSTELEISLNIS